MCAQRHRVANPATEQTLWFRDLTTPDEVRTMVRCAVAAHRGWRATPAADRCAALRRVAELLRGHATPLADTLTREQGKPLADAVSEVTKAANVFDYYADPALLAGSTDDSGGRRSEVTHEPAGLAVAVVPNNYPVTLLAYKLAPALAAGCAMIVKPDLQTPRVTEGVLRLLLAAGIPAGLVAAAYCDPATTAAALVSAPEVDVVTFTGSNRAGRAVLAGASTAMARCVLELGGVNSMVVEPDAPITDTVAAALRKAFRNAGQVCHGISRVYVAAARYPEWLRAFLDGMREVRVGDGTAVGIDVGPLATRAALERITATVDGARDAGAHVHQDWSSVPDTGWFYPLTAITGLADDAPPARTELFGPAVVVTPYSDLDDVAAAINGDPGGLVAYLYGADIRRLTDLAGRIACGSIGINTHEVVSPRFPFCGWRDSGLGHELGPEAVRAFQRPRHVVTRTPVP